MDKPASVVELLREALLLAATDRHGAAARLEKIAAIVLQWVERLRQARPDVTPQSVQDIVRIQVAGPDGRIKHDATVCG